ncbi:MAG: Fic family protein [Bernardetiaceae bacterium]|jgi:Fic family protein|nr:Fic family protein [Bernardetiaceae bacterium]
MPKYIYEYENWTAFTWQYKAINVLFGEVRLGQGKIIGQMNALGFAAKSETALTALTLEVVKSSEIEGEILNYDQVRSSIARRLGINTAGLVPSSRYLEGVVEMMLDATQRYRLPLTEERLWGWHAALFPTGYSGPYPIEVGRYRTGQMRVVSGAMGKEKVHYEAVKPQWVKIEMDKFLAWFNQDHSLDLVLKAAIAHFWFIIIHPFDDGNGRIGRAITEMLLARAEGSGERFYSLSSQILTQRKQYYEVLQKVQYSSGDITEWLVWFLECLKNAMSATEHLTQLIVQKAKFWQQHEHTPLNERQRLMINKLLDGLVGKLQTSKWAKMTKTSTDTGLRDIKDLIDKGILQPTEAAGRNVSYQLADIIQA